MPRIDFQNVSKTFGQHTVIGGFDATIEDGEFLVLLGPSGCGKSTLLRMIAGLTEISGGDIQFDGKRANDWTPHQRGVAFVFQSYALYPHMTVRGNITFPLVMDRFRKWYHIPGINAFQRWRLARDPQVAGAVERIAEQLELGPLLNRRPASLSGGQRQRVALARSLVRDPSLYLLDEPLSNLDAKLRTQMRAEITALHQRVGKTFIYVTHDQVEAMTMASRIIVMDKGEIQQIDTPDGIYDNPVNTFVARFVGAPPMNLIPVTLSGAGQLSVGSGLSWSHEGVLPSAAEAIFGIRPENLTLHPDHSGKIPVRVSMVERLGAETVIGCRLDAGAVDEVGLTTRDMVFVRTPGHPGVKRGEACSVSYAAEAGAWFDKDSSRRLDLALARRSRSA
jgi:multiple sugar transport system ATP-binding protein